MIFPILKKSKQRSKSENQLEAFVESKILLLYTRAPAILRSLWIPFFHRQLFPFSIVLQTHKAAQLTPRCRCCFPHLEGNNKPNPTQANPIQSKTRPSNCVTRQPNALCCALPLLSLISWPVTFADAFSAFSATSTNNKTLPPLNLTLINLWSELFSTYQNGYISRGHMAHRKRGRDWHWKFRI